MKKENVSVKNRTGQGTRTIAERHWARPCITRQKPRKEIKKSINVNILKKNKSLAWTYRKKHMSRGACGHLVKGKKGEMVPPSRRKKEEPTTPGEN